MDFLYTDEGIASIFLILIIIIKLTINQQVTTLRFKRTIVSVPGEITFFVLGLLILEIANTTDIKESRIRIVRIIGGLIILAIQYALERYLGDKLSGKWKWTFLGLVIFMYSLSFILYRIVVFGGTN